MVRFMFMFVMIVVIFSNICVLNVRWMVNEVGWILVCFIWIVSIIKVVIVIYVY